MSALPAYHDWTEKQYLEHERRAEGRHEYVAGLVYAMAGASEAHNQIASAIHYLLYSQLLDSSCQVFQSDMRVMTDAAYFYPDIVAVCGTAQYADDHRDTLLNPAVIVEVLSPSTEDYDRGRKFTHYRNIPGLTDYLLVSQQRPIIEHLTRQSADVWTITIVTQPDAQIALPVLGCTLTLADVYRRVTFADDESGS